jgi:hypothetical protein
MNSRWFILALLTTLGLSQQPDTTDTTIATQVAPLPEIQAARDTVTLLPEGKPFFEVKSNLEYLQHQIDSLKQVLKVYEKKQPLPTINEELLNLIKIPQFQHRIELTNGTVVMGEIIQESLEEIIVQTSIGHLAIDRDKVVNITEELPPHAQVELVSDPFVNVFPDREEITGLVKNTGKVRADFVRVIANLWAPTTELAAQDAAFGNGTEVKYNSGVITDTALEPGASAPFRIIVPLSENTAVEYRTYDIRWLEVK